MSLKRMTAAAETY